MAIYDDVKAEFGAGPDFPTKADFTRYFGYAKGEHVGTFETEKGAHAAGASVTEKAFNEEGYKAALAAYRAHEAALVEEWKSRVRAYNPDMNDDVFALIYSRAYDEGHSSGYAEVELLLDEYVDFAADIIKAAQGG